MYRVESVQGAHNVYSVYRLFNVYTGTYTSHFVHT